MFEKLMAIVGDNAEAVALIKTLETSTNSNVETINTLERKLSDVTETRDKFKNGNSLVKSLLGLEAVNEDTIKEAMKALKGKGGDEASQAEIKNLQDLLKQANESADSASQEFEGKLQTMALDNALANAGLGANVANEAMYGIVAKLAREGAVFENDTIIYKKADGTTLYGKNNTPLTITDRIDELKADKNYTGLFKVDVRGGTNTPPTQDGGGSVDIGKISPTQLMKQGRK